MKEVSHKREQKVYSRKAIASGEFGANTLASLQTKTPPKANKNGWFKHMPHKVHAHHWLFGTYNAVCADCGLTMPKNQVNQ